MKKSYSYIVSLCRKRWFLPAGLSRECRVWRRCNVLLGHRRRWGTHAAACVGPAQAARARYLPGTMPGRALQHSLRIQCSEHHDLTTSPLESKLFTHWHSHNHYTHKVRTKMTHCKVIWNKRWNTHSAFEQYSVI